MTISTAYRMLIDGELVESASQIAVINPANKQIVGYAPDCSSEQLDMAIAAARRAFPAWRDRPWDDRALLVKKAAGVLTDNAEELMRLLTSEQGKPHSDALAEINMAAHWMTTMADFRIEPHVIEEDANRRVVTSYVPLGVVGGIAPWNYPVNLSFWKIAPALLTGNCIVLKPSPFTPLAVLRVAELLKDIFPAGVLNIITGGDQLGPWMTSHPGFDKISFTGSTATGKRVMASASADLKRITLELGGNDAAIVMPDVDIPTIVEKLFWVAFGNSSQICVATKRLYVHSKIYDAVAKGLIDYAKSIRIGDGAQQGTNLGPIQNKAQYDRVVGLIDDCKKNGYKFLIGGDVDLDAAGYFIPITIVDNPPEESRVVQEEAFGPVLPLLKFDDVDDVVTRANASNYGLAGSVWSKNLELAQSIAERMETGTIWINEYHQLTPAQPFAGHKQSGLGVENGVEGMLEYMAPRTITMCTA